MKKFVLTLLLFMIISPAFAQKCNCLTNLKWLIKTFEQNDAGFAYVLEKKGEKAYKAHNRTYIEKARNIDNRDECLKLLNNWTEFFRKNHLQVVPNYLEQDSLIRQNFPQVPLNIQAFEQKMAAQMHPTGFEGIWITDGYTIGIMKDSANQNRKYVGFIIESENPNWKPRQIKLEIFKNKDGSYRMKYFMGNHYPMEFKKVENIKGNLLVAGFIILQRKNSEINPELTWFFKSISANKPFLEKISDNTILLRIPSFQLTAKKDIDSVLESNKKLITKTPYLIIDLRNNGGGSDQSYEKIIPFIYTNPIRIVGQEFLSTKLNNQRMEKFIHHPLLSEEDKKWAKESLEKLNKHLGEFVNLDETIVNIQKLDTIYPYPQYVGILINKFCGSTTEQFLLAAKQSKKVKLYGKPTSGTLDISNLNAVTSPCGDYVLWYGLSKSYRIPEMAIDGVGIQPDFYFDPSIKPYEWIRLTKEMLNYH